MAEKVTIPYLWQLKREGKKIVATILYDYQMARIADRAGFDFILVGDSGGRRLLGHQNNDACTMDEMVLMTRSVARGAQRAFVVGDMPFMSYQASIEEAVRNAGRFIKEAGADAVKLEGGEYFAPTVAAIVNAGIPVVGHIGQTPMTSMGMGPREHRTGAASEGEVEAVLRDARAHQDAGACGLVVTRIHPDAAARINKELFIFALGSQSGSHEHTQGPWNSFGNLLGRGEDEPEGQRSRLREAADAYLAAISAQVAELRAMTPNPAATYGG